MPLVPTGEQLLATILKHDSKTTSYKFALLRALSDVVLGHPDLALTGETPVAVPLTRLPSAASLAVARPGLVASYRTYRQSVALGQALQQDASLHFGALVGSDFSAQLAARAVAFIGDVAMVRLAGQRF